jgi:hypothetical protein
VAIPATWMFIARLGLNGMLHFWRQSSVSFDLRQARAGEGSATVIAVTLAALLLLSKEGDDLFSIVA